MKRKNFLLILLMLIFVMFGCKGNNPSSAVYDDYFTYELTSLAQSYRAYTKVEDRKITNTINIPETINGLPVTAVYLNIDKNVKYVNISRNIENIEIGGDFSNLWLINVDENNPNYVTVDGNLYTKDQKTLVAYAGAKIKKYFDVPEGVTSISNTAFSRCNNLIAISFPNTIESLSSQGIIPTAAISNCENIRKVYIPKGIECIDAFVHYNPGENEDLILYFEDDYSNIKGVYNWWPKEKVRYGVSKEDFYLKDDIEYFLDVKTNEINLISNYSDLEKIEIEENVVIRNTTKKVESISVGAFKGSSELKEIKIPISIKKIDENAFLNCNNLENVYYEGTLEDWCNIKFSNEYSNPMFYSKHLYIKDSNNEYYDATSVEELVIPNVVDCIGDYQFYNFGNIKNIVISEKVESIGKDAFYNCSSLENIYYNGMMDDWCDIELGNEYSNLMSYKVNLYMKDSNNEYCEIANLSELIIPDSAINIGDYQFSNFDNIIQVVIPNNVISIGDYAFSECGSLENVYYEGTLEDWCNIKFSNEYSNPMIYAQHMFMLDSNYEYYEITGITELVVPNKVTSIGNYQFYGFNNIKKVVVLDGVTSIGKYAFGRCSGLESITLPFVGHTLNEKKNTHFGYIFGAYSYSENQKYVPGTLKEVIIGGTSISDNAFSFCTDLEKVVILDSVTSIGSSAFNHCIRLGSIVIADSVEKIGKYAFVTCNQLTIYCEATSQPSGWHKEWNPNDRLMVWGYENQI